MYKKCKKIIAKTEIRKNDRKWGNVPLYYILSKIYNFK